MPRLYFCLLPEHRDGAGQRQSSRKSHRRSDFLHKTSGVNYRVYSEDGKVWLSFDRPGDPQVHGTRELLYYIGQGRRGRTYLFSVDGFVFESPVNWYTDRHMWDMAPGYGGTKRAQ